MGVVTEKVGATEKKKSDGGVSLRGGVRVEDIIHGPRVCM